MKLFIALFSLQIALASAMFNAEQWENVPFYAYVTFIGPEMTFYGGGALISNMHVVTAGANVHGFNSWRIGLGSNRRTNHQTLLTNRGTAHPQYQDIQNIRHNDIGIIFLLQPVSLSVNIFPVFLPKINSEAHPYVNVQGLVVGFAGSGTIGREAEENLTAAHVRPIDSTACTPFYATSDPTQHFCAEDQDDRSNFCLGDQGGPFTIIDRDIEVMVAIASLPGCNTQVASHYTRITPQFRQWIRQETGV